LDAWISEPLPPEEPQYDEKLENNDYDWKFGSDPFDNEDPERTHFEYSEVNFKEREMRVREMKSQLINNNINILPDQEPDIEYNIKTENEQNYNDMPPIDITNEITLQKLDIENNNNNNKRQRIVQPRLQEKVEIEDDEDIPVWNEEKNGKQVKPKTENKLSNNPLAQVDLNDDEEPIVLVKQSYPSQTQDVPSPPSTPQPKEDRGGSRGEGGRRRRVKRGGPRGERGQRGGPRGQRGSPRGERRGESGERGSPRGERRGNPQ